jgi:murein DD-endopeptidase MepM/ murein hydrolase activator NlpD
LGNPILYNDPSGHDVGCAGFDASDCSEYNVLTNDIVKKQRMLFKRSPIPVDEIDWLQWYGGTEFAKLYGQKYNYTGYCQGYHCGIDFGSLWGTDIYSGVNGIVVYNAEHKISILSGEYEILFQHISGYSVEVGQVVTPDTIIGQVGNMTNNPSDGNNHLHLEVRYSSIEIGGYKNRIANPLLYMPADTVAGLIDIAAMQNKQAGGRDGGVSFANTDSLNPFDQPSFMTRMPGNLWKIK